jgi:hypothetical protein
MFSLLPLEISSPLHLLNGIDDVVDSTSMSRFRSTARDKRVAGIPVGRGESSRRPASGPRRIFLWLFSPPISLPRWKHLQEGCSDVSSLSLDAFVTLAHSLLFYLKCITNPRDPNHNILRYTATLLPSYFFEARASIAQPLLRHPLLQHRTASHLLHLRLQDHHDEDRLGHIHVRFRTRPG